MNKPKLPHIRAAVPTDRDTIITFNTALALESENKTLAESTLSAGVDAVLADPTRGRYFMAERSGAIAGQTMLTFEWSDWRNGMFWWIQSVYVSPEHRQQGIFSALYRHIENLAASDAGVCGLRLYVDKNNNQATATYRRLGMRLAHYDMLEVDFVLEAGNE